MIVHLINKAYTFFTERIEVLDLIPDLRAEFFEDLLDLVKAVHLYNDCPCIMFLILWILWELIVWASLLTALSLSMVYRGIIDGYHGTRLMSQASLPVP